jgi:hypothetical protein
MRKDVDHVRWQKSSHCASNSCIEVALSSTAARVRDSEDPGGPRLVVPPIAWRSFLDEIREGRFESPEGRFEVR